MILYHFTRSANITAILEAGINCGYTPFQSSLPVTYVSLMSNLNPQGHGLILGQTVVEADIEFDFWANRLPTFVQGVSPARYLKLYDQSEVALVIEIKDKSKKLISFAEMVNLNLKKTGAKRQVLFAATLASTEFPLGCQPEAVIDRKVLEWLKNPEMYIEASKRGWYFYEGKVPPCLITSVLYRQPDGSYE